MESTTHNPILPYSNYVGAFQSGRFVRIQGRSNYDAQSFKMSFLTGPNLNQDDVALFIDLRFGEQTVIRNSKLYSSWGNEERHGHGFPLQRGQSFEVMILCEGNVFKIALNGQHHAEFTHRVPPERITHFSMEGDGTVGILQFEGGSGSGGFAPSAPAPGAMPYPPSGGSGGGFVPPPPLPTHVPPTYSPNPPYGGYQSGPSYAGPYPPAGAPPMYPQTGPAYPQAPLGYPAGGPGAYPPPGQYGYGQPQQGPYPAQQGYQGSGSGGLMGNAQKLLAGVGLAGVASKIPGLIGGGKHGGHGQYPGQQYPGGGGYYPGGGGHSSGGGGGMGMAGPLAGGLGGAAALGLGGALAAKVLKPKKMKKNKLLKYGLPLAGVGAGGYALHKGMKFGRRGSWSGSSSSSSSEEE